MWEIQSCKKDDEFYPKTLRDVKDAPDILYYVGDISVLENVVIAVVGKRDAAERYLRLARRIGEVLAREGFTILNGLAMGVDAYASEGAVEANGKVVAVMPGGLDEIYPKSNIKLAEKIVTAGGCLISEYPNGTKPQKYTFVQRDRIQAMLSNKVFIVDAEKVGGTMHTADYAAKYAKPLGCFVESAGAASPAGNQLLIDSHKASAVPNTEALIDFVGQPDYAQMSLFVH
ncbi:MAG: DNA-protecting protein DprA [Acetatifactor sp.]|nr:DNA-protecting protein DprA [Acetatifactor sp.]